MTLLDYNQPIVPGGHFAWWEYATLPSWTPKDIPDTSRYAVFRGKVVVIPTEQEKANAVDLFTKLEPLRVALCLPLTVTGGCRTDAYTDWLRKHGIPAAKQSAHKLWKAVDLHCPSLSNAELWRWNDKRWAGRMEMLAATPTWNHLDTLNWGKRQRFYP